MCKNILKWIVQFSQYISQFNTTTSVVYGWHDLFNFRISHYIGTLKNCCIMEKNNQLIERMWRFRLSRQTIKIVFYFQTFVDCISKLETQLEILYVILHGELTVDVKKRLTRNQLFIEYKTDFFSLNKGMNLCFYLQTFAPLMEYIRDQELKKFWETVCLILHGEPRNEF